MSGTDPYRSELAASIESLLEGTLDAEQAEEVTRAVAEDSEAAELYWDYVELHTAIRQIYRDKSDSAVPGSAAPTLPNASTPNVPLADDSDEPPSHPTANGGVFGMFVVALSGALFLGGLVVLVGWLGFRADPAAGPGSKAIAHVTSMSDCTWADTSTEDRCSPGLPLVPGECLRIQSGSVKLTYGNGVAVTLTGPVSYRIIDDKSAFLESGFAMAKVPKEAIGFTINTPAGKIIDCGTEFGVTVGKDKKTGVVTADMQVIEGAVDVNLSSPSGTETRRKRFKTGEAVRMSSLSNGSHRSEASDLFDPRTIPGLRLWLNADAGVLRGADGCVMEMIDLIGDSNTSAENARQPAAEGRPRWLSGTINNRPTLVFSGKQYLQLSSKSDLNFQDESVSIFVVGNTSGGTQYFMTSRAGDKNKDPKGFRFTSSSDGGLRYQAAGVTVVQPCDMSRHAVFSVIHDRRVAGANTVALYRNGEQLGRVAKVDDSDISNSFPLTFGANLEAIHKYPNESKNYLHGDLGEILIYDRVLSPQQRDEVETYLIRKYGFASNMNETSGQTDHSPD